MRIDWQTLQDLGILKPEGFQASLLDWANFTRTTGGAHLLKERFRHPLSDIQPLRETQEAVAWLAGHARSPTFWQAGLPPSCCSTRCSRGRT